MKANETEPALFRALPRAAERFPWMPLGAFPTEIHRVEGLAPRSIELWVKREDRAGHVYGGNKIRKLEFLFGEARARGRTRLATFGGTGSHHVLATAIHGRDAGFAVDAALFPQPDDDHVRELLRAGRAAGANLVEVGSLAAVVPFMVSARRREDTEWLAGGGSSPMGTLGWVSGGLEIGEQIARGEAPPFDVVYAALGSCGMVAGLSVGLSGHEAPVVVGVRVVGGIFTGERATLKLARATRKLLDRVGRTDRREARLSVDARFLGEGYGHATVASHAAVQQGRAHGLALDPIYTGKVLAALLADARAGLLDGKRVLFIDSFSHDGWRAALDPAQEEAA